MMAKAKQKPVKKTDLLLLVKSWREKAKYHDGYSAYCAAAYRTCANELESALKARRR